MISKGGFCCHGKGDGWVLESVKLTGRQLLTCLHTTGRERAGERGAPRCQGARRANMVRRPNPIKLRVLLPKLNSGLN